MNEELCPQAHHIGSYAVLKSVIPASTMTGITAVMEDENVDVVLQQLFSQDKQRGKNAIIGEGIVVIVKEPCFTVASDGSYLICVDHVSDLVHLPEGNKLMPVNWGLQVDDLDALAWSKKENDYFRRSGYYAAIDW